MSRNYKIVETNDGIECYSYNQLIAKQMFNSGKTLVAEKWLHYSATTSKHRCWFLGYNIKELYKKFKSGAAELVCSIKPGTPMFEVKS
jgi:hypothetical protein